MIRINRLGALAAVVAAGLAVPALLCGPAQLGAQVIYRDRWVEQQEAKLRAEMNRDKAQGGMREQSYRMRDQQDRMTERMQAQQDRMREQMQAQQERMREQRERLVERSREQRERELERAQELRNRALERAQEQRDRQLEAQLNRDLNRRTYITPPPSVRFKTRWP